VALKMGARIIWMPTLDSAYHRDAFGFGGGFLAQSSGLETGTEGISILHDGRLMNEVRDIMALVKERGVALATGHVSFDEIRALVDEAAAQGFRKLILTHPYDKAPGLTRTSAGARAAARAYRVRVLFHYSELAVHGRRDHRALYEDLGVG
jgi:Family of unknown function (DUF6282)